MPLILRDPPLCSYVEADTVLSVGDVVALGEIHRLMEATRKRVSK